MIRNIGVVDSGGFERIGLALTRFGERTLTWPVLCERAGVEHVIADRLWRALGFPDVAPDELAYTDDDVRALQIATEGLQALEGEERERARDYIVGEARIVSGHLARIAEQQVGAFTQLGSWGLRQGSIAAALEHGLDRSPLGWLIMYGLRRRIDEARRRRGSTEAAAEPVLAVGFVDLVGFTRASSGLDAIAFGWVFDRFEALAWDEVTEAGGRVVKMIGDRGDVRVPAHERCRPGGANDRRPVWPGPAAARSSRARGREGDRAGWGLLRSGRQSREPSG